MFHMRSVALTMDVHTAGLTSIWFRNMRLSDLEAFLKRIRDVTQRNDAMCAHSSSGSADSGMCYSWIRSNSDEKKTRKKMDSPHLHLVGSYREFCATMNSDQTRLSADIMAVLLVGENMKRLRRLAGSTDVQTRAAGLTLDTGLPTIFSTLKKEHEKTVSSMPTQDYKRRRTTRELIADVLYHHHAAQQKA